MLLTRPYLECQIAERVRARSNVRILEAAVDELAFDSDRKRVTGVRIRSQVIGSSVLTADLTIDASGRGSHTPQWLGAFGYGKPAESSVKVNVTYASRLYRPGPERTDWKGLLISPRAPDKKFAAVFTVEGNRWLVTLVRCHGVCPPTDEAGYLEFARTLPVPDVYRAIATAEPLTPIVTYNYPTNIRRHYDRVKPVSRALPNHGRRILQLQSDLRSGDDRERTRGPGTGRSLAGANRSRWPPRALSPQGRGHHRQRVGTDYSRGFPSCGGCGRTSSGDDVHSLVHPPDPRKMRSRHLTRARLLSRHAHD